MVFEFRSLNSEECKSLEEILAKFPIKNSGSITIVERSRLGNYVGVGYEIENFAELTLAETSPSESNISTINGFSGLVYFSSKPSATILVTSDKKYGIAVINKQGEGRK